MCKKFLQTSSLALGLGLSLLTQTSISGAYGATIYIKYPRNFGAVPHLMHFEGEQGNVSLDQFPVQTDDPFVWSVKVPDDFARLSWQDVRNDKDSKITIIWRVIPHPVGKRFKVALVVPPEKWDKFPHAKRRKNVGSVMEGTKVSFNMRCEKLLRKNALSLASCWDVTY